MPSNKQRLAEINKQLEGLEKINNKTSEIVDHGKIILKNDSIEDKDDSITAIKRVENVLEEAIGDAFQYAKDSEQPRVYDSIARMIKEFSNLQTTKMNIHKSFSSSNDPIKSDGEELTDTNQVATNVKDILEKIEKEKTK